MLVEAVAVRTRRKSAEDGPTVTCVVLLRLQRAHSFEVGRETFESHIYVNQNTLQT
jgi:hypothetical protein